MKSFNNCQPTRTQCLNLIGVREGALETGSRATGSDDPGNWTTGSEKVGRVRGTGRDGAGINCGLVAINGTAAIDEATVGADIPLNKM